MLSDGSVALVIGDVAGHDVEAAARMGEARNILRGIAGDRVAPASEILGRVDRVMTTFGTADLVTAVYARAKRDADGWEVEFANAGHPPPLVIRRTGDTEFLAAEPGLALGIGDDTRPDGRVRLGAGDTLLLYTDGLVERRDLPLDEGMQQMREVAAALVGAPLEQLTETLAELPARAGAVTDDVALLAVRPVS